MTKTPQDDKTGTIFVARHLPALGYRLRKGDAARVAAAIGGDLSEETMIRAAKELGIGTDSLNANGSYRREMARLGTGDKAVADAAASWLAAKAAEKLGNDALQQLCEMLADEAATGLAGIIEVDQTPWDFSTRGKLTGQPHDLSSYETIRDFLDAPNGQTEPTFTSGMGFSATTFRDDFLDAAREIVMDAIEAAMDTGWADAPDDISAFMTRLANLDEWMMNEFAADYVHEQLGKLGRDEIDLLAMIEKLPFADTILRFRPDLKGRLERDRETRLESERLALERRQLGERALEAIVSRVRSSAALRDAAQGQRINADNSYLVSTEILRTVRSPGDIEAVRIITDSFPFKDLTSKRAANKIKNDLRNWLSEVDQVDNPDFHGVLPQLFTALDNAWKRDGRLWHVTILQGGAACTFSQDNWGFMLAFALRGGVAPTKQFVVVLRRFESITCPDRNMPYKTVAGMAIDNEHVRFIGKDEMRVIHQTDATTGKALPPEPTIRYESADLILPAFTQLIRWKEEGKDSSTLH